MTLINTIMEDEGFSGIVYKDHLNNDTLGYGTLMPITKEEAGLILQHRLYNMMAELRDNKQDIMNILSNERQDILFEMAYQMGVPKLMKFKLMWKALESLDYKEASEEMVDSLWATQTPNRAIRLAIKMKG